MSESSPADPFELRKLYKYLRVADVADGLDGLGYFNLGLIDQDIRPLFGGIQFWGVAFTIRCVPSNRPMWPLDSSAEVVKAHKRWFDKVGNISYHDQLQEGHVVVTATGGAQEVGFWGSANAMGVVAEGAVGIVTDGYCRDTGELEQQGTPICARGRGRTIIPGRIMSVETQATVACGGAQVRPGDIIGCDADGLIVVPIEVAKTVARHARAVRINDMKLREKYYRRLGKQPDETVDWQKVEAYYQELDPEG
ncbi:MAG: RraA family protein [Phycisphaeraceae bacterium]